MTGGFDSVLRVWNSSNKQKLFELVGHKDAIKCCDIDATLRRVVSTANESDCVLWDLNVKDGEPGKEIFRFKAEHPYLKKALSFKFCR